MTHRVINNSATNASPLVGLAEYVASIGIKNLTPAASEAIDNAVRCSLLCVGLGGLQEQAMAPARPQTVELSFAGPRDIFAALGAAVFEGTLGGAADLDPVDLGPAHIALPATIAACIGAQVFGRDDRDVADAVVAGIEAGVRLRRSLKGVRPGAGMHSVGTFGLFAAAAAIARLLELPVPAVSATLGIALTRAAGLSINNASTQIGLTHFGWAAAHGLEAGWLASQGIGASLDLEGAFGVLFAGSVRDFAILEDSQPQLDLIPFAFKRYPCNIYLNPFVPALAGHAGAGIDRIRVVIPDLPHLDQSRPPDVRQARNSAQAVAAIAALYPARYLSFTGRFLDLRANEQLRSMMDRVIVERDNARPTALDAAVVDVDATSAGETVVNGTYRISELRPWGLSHALTLAAGTGPPGWVESVYESGYVKAHQLVSGFISRPDGSE